MGRQLSCSVSPARCQIVVLICTIVTYIIYTALAVMSIPESQRMFDGSTVCDWEDDSHVAHCPVRLCWYSGLDVAYDDGGFDGAFEKENCLDGQMVGNVIPVAACLSIAGLALHVVCRLAVHLGRPFGGSSFSSGVATGAGFGLCFILFLAGWVFWAITLIGDYYASLYEGMASVNDEKAEYRLKGNLGFFKAAALFAWLASGFTTVDGVLMVRGRRSSSDHYQQKTGVSHPPPPAVQAQDSTRRSQWQLKRWGPKLKVRAKVETVNTPAAPPCAVHVDNPFFRGADCSCVSVDEILTDTVTSS